MDLDPKRSGELDRNQMSRASLGDKRKSRPVFNIILVCADNRCRGGPLAEVGGTLFFLRMERNFAHAI